MAITSTIVPRAIPGPIYAYDICGKSTNVNKNKKNLFGITVIVIYFI